MYKAKLLPTARKDLRRITNYIANVLKNPVASKNFRKAIGEKLDMLEKFPLSCAEYQLEQPVELENVYRMAVVKNYAIFYVLNDDTVEIHRILYAKMDLINQFETPDGNNI